MRARDRVTHLQHALRFPTASGKPRRLMSQTLAELKTILREGTFATRCIFQMEIQSQPNPCSGHAAANCNGNCQIDETLHSAWPCSIRFVVLTLTLHFCPRVTHVPEYDTLLTRICLLPTPSSRKSHARGDLFVCMLRDVSALSKYQKRDTRQGGDTMNPISLDNRLIPHLQKAGNLSLLAALL